MSTGAGNFVIHDRSSGGVDEIMAQDLRHKWERTRCPEIALDNFEYGFLASISRKLPDNLHVEWTGNFEGRGHFFSDGFETSHIPFRTVYGGRTRVASPECTPAFSTCSDTA